MVFCVRQRTINYGTFLLFTIIIINAFEITLNCNEDVITNDVKIIGIEMNLHSTFSHRWVIKRSSKMMS